jgi:hypothetical protein
VKIQTNNLWMRIGATLLSLCYGIVGGFSIYMSWQAPNADLEDRAFWMGVTFLIAAICAISVSWTVRDLSNIWCIPSKKTKYPRPGDDI